MLPGSGLSDTPPDHKSTSAGCLKSKRDDTSPLFRDELFLEITEHVHRAERVMRCEYLIDRHFGASKVPLFLRARRYTHSKIVLYRLMVSFGMEPKSSSKLSAPGRPQYFLEIIKSRGDTCRYNRKALKDGANYLKGKDIRIDRDEAHRS